MHKRRPKKLPLPLPVPALGVRSSSWPNLVMVLLTGVLLLTVAMLVMRSVQTMNRTMMEEDSVGRQARPRLHIVPIPRVKASQPMSYREFFRRTEHTPIIIEGAVEHHAAFRMSFEDLKELCGKAMVNTTGYSTDSTEFSGMVRNPAEPLANYIDEMFLAKPKNANNIRYASFVQLPNHCVVLERLVKVNKYVAFDLQQQSPDYDYEPLQPEMFLGPKGTKSEMHIDAPFYPFWMNVYKGSKKFRTIDFDAAYSAFGKDLNGSRLLVEVRTPNGDVQQVGLEIWNPNLDVFPELSQLTVYEGSVNAGDFLYLPPGMLHGVLNEADSFGISVNSLPIPHAELYINVAMKLENFQSTFISSAGCVNISDISDFSDIVRAYSETEMLSCLHNSPVVRKLQQEFMMLGFEDRSLHDIFGLESSDEYCAYHHYFSEMVADDGAWKSDEHSWQHVRHKDFQFDACQVDGYLTTLSRLLNTRA